MESLKKVSHSSDKKIYLHIFFISYWEKNYLEGNEQNKLFCTFCMVQYNCFENILVLLGPVKISQETILKYLFQHLHLNYFPVTALHVALLLGMNSMESFKCYFFKITEDNKI